MRNVYFFLMIALFPLLSFAASDITVEHPWARPTMGEMRTSAAYMELTNIGKQPEVLLSISTPIAEHASLHSTVVRDDISRMIAIDNLSLPTKEKVSFVPGGLHIMLMGIKKPLQKGDSFPLTLHFLEDKEVEIQVLVE